MTQELQQALEALRECREVLHKVIAASDSDGLFEALMRHVAPSARDAKLRAELVLSLHTKREGK